MAGIPQTEIESKLEHLSEFERVEVVSYYEAGVYYLGIGSEKVKGPNSDSTSVYHDEDNTYKLRLHDHIAYRYEVLKILGKGVVSTVIGAYDHKHKEVVAIKIFKCTENHQVISVREKDILNYVHSTSEIKGLQENHIVLAKDNFVFRGHPCIVLEYLYHDLEHELALRRGGLNIQWIKKITLSLLKALKLLNTCSLIHADLKPENILLCGNEFDIKITDFSHSFFTFEDVKLVIQAELYRAPEVHLNMVPYTTAIDMWSLGCILAELYTGCPLFKGNTIPAKLLHMVQMLGMPPAELWENFSAAKERLDNYLTSCASSDEILPSTSKTINIKHTGKSLHWILRGSGDCDFIDFVSKCLIWDPKERMSPCDALTHNWLRADSETAFDISHDSSSFENIPHSSTLTTTNDESESSEEDHSGQTTV